MILTVFHKLVITLTLFIWCAIFIHCVMMLIFTYYVTLIFLHFVMCTHCVAMDIYILCNNVNIYTLCDVDIYTLCHDFEHYTITYLLFLVVAIDEYVCICPLWPEVDIN